MVFQPIVLNDEQYFRAGKLPATVTPGKLSTKRETDAAARLRADVVRDVGEGGGGAGSRQLQKNRGTVTNPWRRGVDAHPRRPTDQSDVGGLRTHGATVSSVGPHIFGGSSFPLT